MHRGCGWILARPRGCLKTPLPRFVPTLVQTFGDHAGHTQEQLGERADVDRKTINRIENGMYSPHMDKVFQIADALSVPARDLFEWDGVSRSR